MSSSPQFAFLSSAQEHTCSWIKCYSRLLYIPTKDSNDRTFPPLSPRSTTLFCFGFLSSTTLTSPDLSSLVKRRCMSLVCASSIVAWKMMESSEQRGWRPLNISWSYLKHFPGVGGGGLMLVYFFSFRTRWRSLVDMQGVSRLCAISAADGFLMRSLFVKSTQGGLNECLAFAL